jgi:DNA-binding NarL/FixJ family response regulator
MTARSATPTPGPWPAQQPSPLRGACTVIVPAGLATAGRVAGPLSERERAIVALLACGATDAQIAGQPYVLMNTVRSHLEPIRKGRRQPAH